MAREDILIGRVTGPHGVKGWIRVFSYTDPIEQIFSYTPWLLGSRQVNVEEGQLQGKRLVARLEGVDDRDTAEALRGVEIRIGKDQLPDLEEGEFYWYQLEGLTVVNEAGEVLGRVDHMTETGANDVMVVEASADSIDNRQRLIPYVDDEFVMEVDLERQKITVRWDSDF